jgi:hypothetical protein
MSENSSNSSTEGVIVDPSSLSNNNKKQISPSKKWVFTYNNYDSSDCSTLNDALKSQCEKFAFQEETGECGTKHLQGACVFKTKVRPLSLKLCDGIHWEKMKGTVQQAVDYCMKDDTRTGEMFTNIKIKKKLKVLKELRPWQAQVLEKIDLELAHDDDRSIHWVVDEQGCAGKTAFCKWMTQQERQCLIITGGGYKDIACVLKMAMENDKFDINDELVILFNIPREADDKGMISYKALESLKDGLMTSTKYESTTLVFNPPSVWVFSNCDPELEKLSADRWKVHDIWESMLVSPSDEAS